MSLTYSAALEDSVSDLSGLGCEQSPSAKSILTAEQCSESTGLAYPSSRTLEPSVQLTLDLSISSAEGSHVNPSVLPGSAEARQMTVTSGRKWLALSPKSDLLGYLVRTFLESSVWNSTVCYLTWKVSATPAKRLLFRLVPSMLGTDESEYGLWATPTAGNACGSEIGRHGLQDQVRMRPTQRANAEQTNGSLSPMWVEWLMGFPIGWTALEPSEMQSYRKSRKSSGKRL